MQNIGDGDEMKVFLEAAKHYVEAYSFKLLEVYSPVTELLYFASDSKLVNSLLIPMQMIVLGAVSILVGVLLLSGGLLAITVMFYSFIYAVRIISLSTLGTMFVTCKCLLLFLYPFKFALPKVYQGAEQGVNKIYKIFMFVRKDK